MEFKEFSDSDGKLLVKTARKIVTEYLEKNEKIELDQEFKSKFSFESGVFVTINNLQGLRGCIGFPLPQKKLFNALADASLAAATEDPRFSPVKKEELNEIVFEVTVLSPPVKIQVSNPLDYPTKIKVGTDGLIIKYDFSSGLLLPQVPVEYGWSEKEFLNNTCEKAGLAADMWKDPKTEVLKFEGIIYKEEKPNGNVVRKKL